MKYAYKPFKIQKLGKPQNVIAELSHVISRDGDYPIFGICFGDVSFYSPKLCGLFKQEIKFKKTTNDENFDKRHVIDAIRPHLPSWICPIFIFNAKDGKTYLFSRDKRKIENMKSYESCKNFKTRNYSRGK
jgi:hypothetical protein